jgi:PAS domain S-box-containing protein
MKSISEAVIETAQDAHILINEEGTLIEWNPQAERMFGWLREEAIGRSMLEAIIPVEYRAAYLEGIQRFVATGAKRGVNQRMEIEGQHRSGAVFPIELSLAAIRMTDGLTWSGFIRDITARHRMEKLHATEQAIGRILLVAQTLEEASRQFLESACTILGWSVGVLWKVDSSGSMLRCVDLWSSRPEDVSQFVTISKQLTFVPGVGLPGRVWNNRSSTWVQDVTVDLNFPRSAYAAQLGLHTGFAFPILYQEQVLGVMEFFATEILEPDRDVLQMFERIAGHVAQFLARTQAEETARLVKDKAEQSAKEQRRILSAVRAFFIELNNEGLVLQWTPAAEDLLGISVLSAIGSPFDSLSIKWEWEVLTREISQARRLMQEMVVDKLRLKMSDGTERLLRVSILPVFSDQGPSVVLMGEDQTEWLRLEHERLHGQKLESIGQLAAGIAHEINTPIQFIGDNLRFLSDGFTDLDAVLHRYKAVLTSEQVERCVPDLIERCRAEERRVDIPYLTDEIPKAIAQSTEGIQRVAKIVRAMKEFAHPGGEEKVLVNLNGAIESTVTVSRNEWKYVADLRTDLAPNLPMVPCLLGQFNQAILNMIVNAAHAIGDVVKDTGKKGLITISSRQVGDNAEIRIADTGTGIPDEIRHKIFDPFFTTKNVGKGTGQGLAIARSIVVNKHQGSIDVESHVGKGTVFIIHLPLSEVRTEPAGEVAA